MNENEISKIIVDEAIYIHKMIGPGMLESVYQSCLSYRIGKAGLLVHTEVPFPVYFEEIKMNCGYRADIVVENKVVIEVKSMDGITDLHIAQALTYLRFLNHKLGLILNFNTILMKDGIRRVVNKL